MSEEIKLHNKVYESYISPWISDTPISSIPNTGIIVNNTNNQFGLIDQVSFILDMECMNLSIC